MKFDEWIKDTTIIKDCEIMYNQYIADRRFFSNISFDDFCYFIYKTSVKSTNVVSSL